MLDKIINIFIKKIYIFYYFLVFVII
jgi:hypothetical protein